MERILAIEGMTCSHCTSRVMKALQTVKGVRSVAVSLETKSATIEGVGLVDEDLRAAVEEAGYQVTRIG